MTGQTNVVIMQGKEAAAASGEGGAATQGLPSSPLGLKYTRAETEETLRGCGYTPEEVARILVPQQQGLQDADEEDVQRSAGDVDPDFALDSDHEAASDPGFDLAALGSAGAGSDADEPGPSERVSPFPPA